MNKDEVKGRVRKAKGKGKELAGKATGSKRLEVKGRSEQVRGKIQSGIGSAKRSLGRLKESFRKS